MIAGMNLIWLTAICTLADWVVNTGRDPLLPECPSPWTPATRLAFKLAALYTGMLLIGNLVFDSFEQSVLDTSKPRHWLFSLPTIGVMFMMMTRESGLLARSVGFAMIVGPIFLVCYCILQALL